MAAWSRTQDSPGRIPDTFLVCLAFCDKVMVQGQTGCEVRLRFQGQSLPWASVFRMVLWSSWLLAPGSGVLLREDEPSPGCVTRVTGQARALSY